MSKRIHVLGAGIVGISCAIELQRRGYDVTLVDRLSPAKETSFGNAGILAAGAVMPEAAPQVWSRLPEILTNRGTDVHLQYRQLAGMLPFLWQFLKHTQRGRYRNNAEALHSILNRSIDAHLQLIDECGAHALLKKRGFLKLYRSKTAFDTSHEDALLEECGIACERLNSQALRDLEPDLRPVFIGARWLTGTASISDPGALANAYADLFLHRGGTLIKRTIRHFQPDGSDWTIHCDDGTMRAERIVVSLGAWSRALLSPLGYRAHLIAERGYHSHFQPKNGVTLNRPIYDVECSYVLAPMDMGYRLTTGIEWAALDSGETPVQLARVVPKAKEAFPLGKQSAEIWMGNRPQTPDSLPLIGRITDHKNLWIATGHGHLGLTLGPITGVLIAQAIDGLSTDVDLAPFSPTRFR